MIKKNKRKKIVCIKSNKILIVDRRPKKKQIQRIYNIRSPSSNHFVADGNFSEFPYIQYLTRKFDFMKVYTHAPWSSKMNKKQKQNLCMCQRRNTNVFF